MDVTAQVNVVFDLLLIWLGLDFDISGYFALRDRSLRRVPRLVSYLYFKLLARAERKLRERRKTGGWATRLARIMWTMKPGAINLVLAGILLILLGLLSLMA